MSIEVTLTQTGFFKKALPLKVILGSHLSYGAFDGLRLSPGEMGAHDFIAYNVKRIGRGFSVIWKKGEKKSVSLRILTPAGTDELRAFYDCAKRIASYWSCQLELDGGTTTLTKFLAGFEEMCDFNLRALHGFAQKILDGESKDLTLFCALWPLVLGPDEARPFAECDSLNAFSDYLHQKQSINVYYARPLFYEDEGGCFGVYVLTEDVPSIFPLKPSVPFGTIDNDTGKAPEISRWMLCLCSSTRGGRLGQMPYEELLGRLPKEKVSYYDPGNILIESVSLAEMETMLSQA